MATDRFAPTADLPRLTKEVMVLTTLVQGAGVYALLEGWFGPAGPLRLIALSLLLAVPGFFVLCVRQLGDRLLWRGMAALALLLVALHGSVWWLLGSQDARSGSAWVPWLLSQGALLFIALAWMQALQQQRSLRRVPYALLFDHAWNNAVVLGFALQFVALGWAVLGLWAGLFALVKVRLFADTFTAPAFVYMATGLMAGLGVLLARGQPRPLRLMLQLVLTLYRLLLPLLALVVVLFVAFLPFTGVQPLWETRKAAPLLMGVLLCLLVFVNAVYQDGSRQAAPYPSALRALIAAARDTGIDRDSLSLKLERIELAPYFDRLISSHDYGFPKEDQQFWSALQADFAFEPARALFIDDSLPILRSARTFGIAHLLAVRQPDSRQPAKDSQEFAAVEDYRELLP